MTRPRLRALAALAVLLVPVAAAQAAATVQRTWHADQARVPDARPAGRDGDGVVVAVLDSWVDGAHPDFEGRVLAGADCTSGTCRPGQEPDSCTHGTHVAGTVASSSYGVAPRALVLPVQVLASSGGRCSGTDRAVAAGIRWAVASGADVVNLSLGTLVPGLSSSSAISGAVTEAARAGAVVVFAAGNARLPLADSYGGSALIVAATGPDGSIAEYSQRGVGVSLAAPGGDAGSEGACTADRCVTSLFPGRRYAVAAGTSMAAPHVSGIAALLLAQDPSRTREQVVDRLRSTARPLSGAGSGLVDATAALAPAPATSSTASSPVTSSPATSAPTTTAPAQTAPAPAPSTGSGPSTGSAPTGTAAVEPAPGLAEPVPLPDGELPPVPAPEVGPVPAGTTPPLAAEPAADLPTGPPALALALVLTGALGTALAGLHRSPR